VFVILVVTVFAIPAVQSTMAAYRGSAAATGVAGQLSLAKMRAGAGFTRSRVTIDTSNNTYRREMFDKASSSYVLDSTDQTLGSGVAFGYGGIVLPAGGQATIEQSTQIIFNSRGLPVDEGGSPVGNHAIYLNNDGRFYAVTINTAGQVRTWRHSGTAWEPL
jgi:Tfp pilus assembly protein FimT